MSAVKFIQAYAKKSLTKNQGSGIINLPGAMQSEAKAGEIVAMLQQAGIPMNQLDDFIRSEADVAKFLNIIEAASKPKVYSGQAAVDQLDKLFPKKGEVLQFPQKTSFKEQVEAMKKSGDIVDPNNLKKNDNVLQRDMFNNSNLNNTKILKDGKTKSIIPKDEYKEYKNDFDKEILGVDTVADTITYIKTLEPIKAMKEANSIIGRKGKYKDLTPEQSKRILQDTEDHIFQRDPDNLYDYDPEDMAKGGRAGFYTGGITDVEPSLDDIGHGADAMNARTRLMSPGNQATTSTGLNYLLAEDNDNMRIPFAGGGDPKRRAFLKLLASLTGGAAAFKTGLLSLGEGGTKKAVSETVKQAAGSGGQVPPYFLNLVKKIKTMGDDVTEVLAYKDKQKVTKYKDYELTEDITTGEQTIQRMKVLDDGSEAYYGQPLTEETYMSYKPGKGQADETMKGKTPPDEYEEGTALLRSDRQYAGEVVDESATISDDVIKEGTIFEDTMSEFGKAEGGRIGYNIGGLSKLGINSTSRRFLEKVFGKEKFNTMIQNDPRMHRGMLEVVEMFRSKDKEGLKMYLQKFMPNMDDTEIEKFIVGDSGTEGIEGQLIRLGSGREYKNLINMSKEADQIRKLDDFDIDGVSKNAEGGRIGLFLGGGLTAGKGLAREMLKFMSKGSTNAKSPKELLQLYNPKQFNKLLNNPANTGKISPATGETANEMILDMMSKTKNDRSSMVGDLIGSARKIKKVDDDIKKYKQTIIKQMLDGGIDEDTAYSFAEKMAKEMKENAAPQLTSSPPKITEQGLLELENIQKNLLTKGRKLQATGGLTTMLGE